MKRLLLLLSILLLCNHLLPAQCSERFMEDIYDDYILHSDIKYGENYTSENELYELFLDVYEPNELSTEPRPLVIFIHGGSFVSGNKEAGEVKWFCEDLPKRGIVTASINYRKESSFLSLTSEELMVKAVMRAVEDAKAAIRFFRKDALEENIYNIDPGQIVLGGTSAGSIAALHAAYMNDFQNLKPKYQTWFRDLSIDTLTLAGNSGNPGYSDTVSALINISGAVAELSFLNGNFHIPIFHSHNTIDFSVPFQFGHPYFIPFLPLLAGSYPIHKRVKQNGGYSILYQIPEINHVPHTNADDGGKYEEVYNTTMFKMSQFLGEVLPCEEFVTGINDSSLKGISVYPNPTSSIINIEGLKPYEEYTFRLMNVLGQPLPFAYQKVQSKITIEGDPTQSGNFLLEIIELNTGKSFNHLGIFK